MVDEIKETEMSHKSGARTVKANDIATREQLLNALNELMTESNSTNVSLSEIAARSGLNAALVKYYFGSKAGLMLALLSKAMGAGVEQIRHLPDLKLPPEEKIRIHISGMVNSYFKYPYINRLMHQLLAENPETFGPLIVENFSKPVAEAQKKILDEGVAAGLFQPVDPLHFYFHIVGACDTLFYGRYQLQYLFGVKEINDELRRKFIDYLYNAILNGILVKS